MAVKSDFTAIFGIMNVMKDFELANRIADAVAYRGGRVYYVGGCVRDAILGIESKDIDIEVHGIAPSVLEEILDSVGERISMGESFGIYSVKGFSLDIAMPRKETVRGKGHRDFDVFVDPFIGTEKAAMRRDFTVNSIMRDVLTGEIIDPHGGVNDLSAGILRHVSDVSFPEDPLRVFRMCQFASRFGFTVAEETKAICKTMDITALSCERVEAELKKALLNSKRPSVFFELLRELGMLSPWFSELEPLIGLEQDPIYHEEGDVWTHTMLVVDSAAELREKAENPYAFMLSALTHDLGKALTTVRDGERVHSYGHEEKGIPLVRSLVSRLSSEKKLMRCVLELVREHMRPNTLAAFNSSVKKTNAMFDSVSDPMALVLLAAADIRGQCGKGVKGEHTEFLKSRLEIYREYMSRPYVTGKDLIDNGVKSGEDFSRLLEFAHKLRLAGVCKDDALKQTLALVKKS